jgi:hypothetical protein
MGQLGESCCCCCFVVVVFAIYLFANVLMVSWFENRVAAVDDRLVHEEDCDAFSTAVRSMAWGRFLFSVTDHEMEFNSLQVIISCSV